MSDITKTAKIIKRWYYSTANWQTMWWWAISPFYDFCCFRVHVAINKCKNLCFVHLL